MEEILLSILSEIKKTNTNLELTNERLKIVEYTLDSLKGHGGCTSISALGEALSQSGTVTSPQSVALGDNSAIVAKLDELQAELRKGFEASVATAEEQTEELRHYILNIDDKLEKLVPEEEETLQWLTESENETFADKEDEEGETSNDQMGEQMSQIAEKLDHIIRNTSGDYNEKIYTAVRGVYGELEDLRRESIHQEIFEQLKAISENYSIREIHEDLVALQNKLGTSSGSGNNGNAQQICDKIDTLSEEITGETSTTYGANLSDIADKLNNIEVSVDNSLHDIGEKIDEVRGGFLGASLSDIADKLDSIESSVDNLG